VVRKVWQCWRWAGYLYGGGGAEGVAVLEVGGGPGLPGQEGEEAAGWVARRVRDPLQDGVQKSCSVPRTNPATKKGTILYFRGAIS
jgi:hypothetical protein